MALEYELVDAIDECDIEVLVDRAEVDEPDTEDVIEVTFNSGFQFTISETGARLLLDALDEVLDDDEV